MLGTQTNKKVFAFLAMITFSLVSCGTSNPTLDATGSIPAKQETRIRLKKDNPVEIKNYRFITTQENSVYSDDNEIYSGGLSNYEDSWSHRSGIFGLNNNGGFEIQKNSGDAFNNALIILDGKQEFTSYFDLASTYLRDGNSLSYVRCKELSYDKAFNKNSCVNSELWLNNKKIDEHDGKVELWQLQGGKLIYTKVFGKEDRYFSYDISKRIKQEILAGGSFIDGYINGKLVYSKLRPQTGRDDALDTSRNWDVYVDEKPYAENILNSSIIGNDLYLTRLNNIKIASGYSGLNSVEKDITFLRNNEPILNFKLKQNTYGDGSYSKSINGFKLTNAFERPCIIDSEKIESNGGYEGKGGNMDVCIDGKEIFFRMSSPTENSYFLNGLKVHLDIEKVKQGIFAKSDGTPEGDISGIQPWFENGTLKKLFIYYHHRSASDNSQILSIYSLEYSNLAFSGIPKLEMTSEGRKEYGAIPK